MELSQYLDALGALAHAGRLEAFRLLVRAGPEGVAAGEIARTIGIPPSTMSTHLAVLTRAGLIAARRESRTIFYGIETNSVRALFDFLAADCCGGRPELCASPPALAALPERKLATKRKTGRIRRA